MRVIVADLEATYSGRGETHLDRAIRAIILKKDNSISIHNDKSNKPLNYMGGKYALTENTNPDGTQAWVCENSKEQLTIILHLIISDTNHPLAHEDAGLQRDATEKHLTQWLSQNLHTINPDLTLIGIEQNTGDGAVDILAHTPDGTLCAIEVKRTAMIGAVGQCQRYIEALKDAGNTKVQGIIAALNVRPKTEQLANRRGITTHPSVLTGTSTNNTPQIK